MNQKPLISIIMPCFNAKRYIGEAVHSVLYQTYPNWELLIIDDGSDDGTLDELNNFSDERIRLLNSHKNHGVAYARNKGISCARGDIICFLDTDDQWEKEKLEMQLNYLQEKKADLCFTSYKMINEEGQLIKDMIPVPESTDYQALLKDNVIACSSVMVKADALKYASFPRERHEDYLLWLELARKNIQMAGLNQPLMIYRKHNDSISGNKIQSAVWRWNIYRKHENLSLRSSCFYFYNYVKTGIKKHA